MTVVLFMRLNSVEIDQAGWIGGDMRLLVLSRTRYVFNPKARATAFALCFASSLPATRKIEGRPVIFPPSSP